MTRRELEWTVLAALAERSPCYVVDLAAAIDEHPVAVETVCASLRDRGELRSIGYRRYDVTAAGRRQLADGHDDDPV
ncbi:hypothetical protein [Natrinema altunense]|uniref:MarR family transcriptional regulator n=1 Tax=Natrinema altunense (strain JCM 12890 / CGMCC 1.3731 / AJ2) TaxID=1227494 RepID=L9ZHU4_NATA2|nr:hypothetical protein [Natrinema altunense]ELY85934.1 hypothetical protein C485_12053 [Natrinema altunense JCM 12890]